MKKTYVLLLCAVVLSALVFVGCGARQEVAASTLLPMPENTAVPDTVRGERTASDGKDETGEDLKDAVLYEGVIAQAGQESIGVRHMEATYGEDGVDAAMFDFDTPVDTFAISANTEIFVRNVSRETEEVTMSDGSASDLKVGSVVYIFYIQEAGEQLAVQVTVVNVY